MFSTARLRALLAASSIPAAFAACGDTESDPFDIAANCECEHRWDFDDGDLSSEQYTEVLYCFEGSAIWVQWVSDEVDACQEAYPDATSQSCSCECVPTGLC